MFPTPQQQKAIDFMKAKYLTFEKQHPFPEIRQVEGVTEDIRFRLHNDEDSTVDLITIAPDGTATFSKE